MPRPSLAAACGLALATLILGAGCGGVRARGGGEVARPDVKVVVLDIRDANPELRDAVLDLLAHRYRVVDDRAYRDEARRRRADTMDRRDVARVTRALGIDAVAYGRLIERRGRARLKLTLRAGETGRVLDRLSLAIEDGRVKRRDLREQLYAALDEIAPDPDEPMPEPEAPAADDGDEAPLEETPPARVARRAPVEEAPLVEDEPAPATKPAKIAARPARPEPVAKPAKVAAKPAKAPPAAKPASTKAKPAPPEEPAIAAVQVDGDGQAIDDEMPGALSQR
jgi:hypothetical protein